MVSDKVITDKHDVKCAGLALARLVTGDAKLNERGFDAAAVIKSCKSVAEDERKLFETIVNAVATCLREKSDERPSAAAFRAMLGDRNASVDLRALTSLAASCHVFLR